MNLQLSVEGVTQKELLHWLSSEFKYLPKDKLDDIKIVLGEVIQNIIRHSYNMSTSANDIVEIRSQTTNDQIVILVRDFAQPCNPSFIDRYYTPSDKGHMGISIIKKLTEQFSITPLRDGNETKLVFKINEETI